MERALEIDLTEFAEELLAQSAEKVDYHKALLRYAKKKTVSEGVRQILKKIVYNSKRPS